MKFWKILCNPKMQPIRKMQQSENATDFYNLKTAQWQTGFNLKVWPMGNRLQSESEAQCQQIVVQSENTAEWQQTAIWKWSPRAIDCNLKVKPKGSRLWCSLKKTAQGQQTAIWKWSSMATDCGAIWKHSLMAIDCNLKAQPKCNRLQYEKRKRDDC